MTRKSASGDMVASFLDDTVKELIIFNFLDDISGTWEDVRYLAYNMASRKVCLVLYDYINLYLVNGKFYKVCEEKYLVFFSHLTNHHVSTF